MDMRRRKFLTLLGGAAAWPLAAGAQQPDRIRRIGVLNSVAETDLAAQGQAAAFRKRLDELGWTEGRNIQIDYRWGNGSIDRMREIANELAQLNPDVIVSATTPATAALQAATRTIPVVVVNVADAIGAGFVASIAQPGGNITGFGNVESAMGGKWVEFLHDVAPSITRIEILFNPQTAPYARLFMDTFHSAASGHSIEQIEAPVYSAPEIEASLTKLGGQPGAGLIVMPDTSMFVHREMIISLVERYHLPTIYPFRFFVIDGGLMSYGIDLADSFRGAATYVDRILRGAKPSELPVQLPAKFELVVNLKTAKALGLTVPLSMQMTADEVIE
jgi:putative tryptophan/tyrosine transport system substrate-binding protein